jgi:DNA-binding LytR/AlgR family response regulator
MRLLVIEDDEMFAGMVEAQLSILMGKNFFEAVTFFPSLCAARAGMEEFKPDVVLFDIHLPDGQAFDEAAEWLMQSDVLRICMTGRKRSRYIHHAMENGVLAFVEKNNGFLPNLQKALSKASIQLRNRQQAEYFSHHAFQKHEHLRATLEETQEHLAEKDRLLAQLVPQHSVSDAEPRQALPEEKIHLRIRQDGLIRTIVISPHDILVIESHDNKVFIALHDSETVHEVTITLKALESLLPPLLFVRCHASYLVHLSSIIAFSAKDLTLTTGEIVPISRARQEQTHAAIASYRLPKRPEYQVAHSA